MKSRTATICLKFTVVPGLQCDSSQSQKPVTNQFFPVVKLELQICARKRHYLHQGRYVFAYVCVYVCVSLDPDQNRMFAFDFDPDPGIFTIQERANCMYFQILRARLLWWRFAVSDCF